VQSGEKKMPLVEICPEEAIFEAILHQKQVNYQLSSPIAEEKPSENPKRKLIQTTHQKRNFLNELKSVPEEEHFFLQ
jgi:hypothetical protein